ncbi:MAG TPA: hypothetical protein VJW51_04120 [Candidatus Acidoferrales bacterium]|nr:hypothetical protein [Candidatus Acidoferrales bacterium]
MRSMARTLTAAVGLGMWLLPALPARAQQQSSQSQAAALKFKDPALQQYLVAELTTIEEKLDKLSARLDAMEGQLAKVKEQQQALASDFRTNQELSKATDTSVTSLRASNQEDLMSVKSDVARIRRDLTEMSDEMRKASAPPPAPAASQPKLEGYITQATATSITINLGSAAGVEVGMRFGVYRAAEPQTRIGTLEVTEVLDANNSRAKTVASNPNTKFQFSDIVRPY